MINIGVDIGTNDTTALAFVLHEEVVYVCNYGNVPRNTIATKLEALAATSLVIEPRERESPEWGWWAAYYPPTPYHWNRSANPSFGEHRRRPQARACRADQRRWKRRRFLQALRSLA